MGNSLNSLLNGLASENNSIRMIHLGKDMNINLTGITEPLNALIQVAAAAINLGLCIVKSLLCSASKVVSVFTNVIPGVVEQVTAALSNIISNVGEAADEIDHAFVDGVKSISGIFDNSTGLADSIEGEISNMFKIHSPSISIDLPGLPGIPDLSRGGSLDTTSSGLSLPESCPSCNLLSDIMNGINEAENLIGNIESSVIPSSGCKFKTPDLKLKEFNINLDLEFNKPSFEVYFPSVNIEFPTLDIPHLGC